MKRLLVFFILFRLAFAIIADPMLGHVEYTDSTFVYIDGQPISKHLFSHDDQGKEIVSVDFDFVNGQWIGNCMHIHRYENHFEITVNFYWELNRWVPSEMYVDEFNGQHQKLSSFSCEWEVCSVEHCTQLEKWQNCRKVEYAYDENGDCIEERLLKSPPDGNLEGAMSCHAAIK